MKKILSFKGFDKDLKCRGFQYEVGKEYEQSGKIVACENGFHACENPFDVLNYYDDIFKNRYCEVEQSGEMVRHNDKIASSKISIKAEIGFTGLFNAGIEWLKEITSQEKIENNNNIYWLSDKGDYSADISSGNNCTKISSSGNFAQISSSGNSVQISSSGDCVKISSGGNYAQIGSSGNGAQIGSSGNGANIGSSGKFAQIGSNGKFAQIGSNGNGANIGSSGKFAQIGSNGNGANIGSSGKFAKICSSGNSARVCSSGENSVICCAGNNSVVKAKQGSWITLAEWVYDDNKSRYIPKCVKTEYVDGERIKADTWYKLINGEFKEV